MESDFCYRDNPGGRKSDVSRRLRTQTLTSLGVPGSPNSAWLQETVTKSPRSFFLHHDLFSGAYDMTASTYTRLHVSPFNPDLLPIVVGPSLAEIAENISFQTIDTFPENNYGFIDLPELDARALISRLNGAILKGRKMKVEMARPKKRSHDGVHEAATGQSKSHKKAKKEKKSNKDEGLLDGYELPAGRKVKRGWTEPRLEEPTRSKHKDKKKSKHQAPSQYTDKEEMLFRTKLPPNKKHPDTTTESNRKTRRKHGGETVVHEFKNTDIQPDFIRDAVSSARTAEYVDQVGWVDEKGKVVEVTLSLISQKKPHKADDLRVGMPIPTEAKILGEQSSFHKPTAFKDTLDAAVSDDRVHADLQEDGTSHTDTSSPLSGADSDSESNEEHTKPEAQNKPQTKSPTNPETPHKVHPLEALFKKPKLRDSQHSAKPSLEIETTFSFFDQSAPATAAADDDNDDDDDDDELPPMPATPFTSLDMHSRGVRSAAPTPDTAHPSRFASFANELAAGPAGDRSDKGATIEPVDGDASDDAPIPGPEQSGERPESDFEKRFWAERGQNSRAWKTRRRAAIKEQRQQENRLRRPRNW